MSSPGPGGGAVAGEVRLTASPNRELACRQRLPQYRASARRPAGIDPPHQPHFSGGGEGARGGLTFSRAREAAWRQRLQQNFASARRPAGIGPPHQPTPAVGGRGRRGRCVGAAEQAGRGRDRGARASLKSVDADSRASGVAEGLADRGLARLRGRVRPRPPRIRRAAARRPEREPVSQLLRSTVEVVPRPRGQADTSPGPAGDRARRVAGGPSARGVGGGFFAHPLAGLSPRDPHLPVVIARGRRRGGPQLLVVEVRTATPAVRLPVHVPRHLRAPRRRRVLPDEDLPSAQHHLWPKRPGGAAHLMARRLPVAQELLVGRRQGAEHQLAHRRLLHQQRRVARRRRRRPTDFGRWIGRGRLAQRLRTPYNAPPARRTGRFPARRAISRRRGLDRDCRRGALTARGSRRDRRRVAWTSPAGHV